MRLDTLLDRTGAEPSTSCFAIKRSETGPERTHRTNRSDGSLMTPSTLPSFQLSGRQQFLRNRSPRRARLWVSCTICYPGFSRWRKPWPDLSGGAFDPRDDQGSAQSARCARAHGPWPHARQARRLGEILERCARQRMNRAGAWTGEIDPPLRQLLGNSPSSSRGAAKAIPRCAIARRPCFAE